MSFLATALTTLSAQMLIGAAFYCFGARVARGSGRRARAGWADAARSLRRTVPFSAGALAVGLALGGRYGTGLLAGIWAEPWSFLLVGSLPAASCFLTLEAGWREHAGRRRAARREVRLAGFLLFCGTFALLVLTWADLILRLPFRRAVLFDSPASPLFVAFAMVSLGGAAFIAALAALSGKPRPSGQFAVALYVSGVLGLLATTGLLLP